jgi:hypothetical protein
LSPRRPGDALALWGITGDLARKLIRPALYRLAERGLLTVPGTRAGWNLGRLRAHVGDAVRRAVDEQTLDTVVLDKLLAGVRLVAGDYTTRATFDLLDAALREAAGSPGQRPQVRPLVGARRARAGRRATSCAQAAMSGSGSYSGPVPRSKPRAARATAPNR